MSEPVTVPTDGPRTRRARAAAREVWRDRLTRFAHAGLGPTQFCAQEGLCLATFYAWRRRLRTAPPDPGTAPEPGSQPPPRWLPVRLHDPGAPLELALPSGAVLRIAAGADEATLRCLLHLLGVLTC